MRPFQPTQTLIAAAISNGPWPAWAPRPESPQPTPEGCNPAIADFGCGLPTVEEARQAPKVPGSRPGQATPDGDDQDDSVAAQVRLIKTIGARMREAREELAGLSQQQAAALLGYKNSSKLAKIEGATDTRSVPLQTIVRAAAIYQVSIDFLFGSSDDWERDPRLLRERQAGRWFFEHLDQARTRDALAFAELRNKVEAVSALIPKLADGAEQAKAAFERFQDINPSYNDLIGGARLQASIQTLDEAGRQARLALRRLHLDLSGNTAEVRP
ncbi:helix-turn-helix domain-containing protein [Azonexus sp. IMCC34842]|uniref:helix-turn-helix domain-containing protein n=1 Tax=Azonexus sp. IMCC34842 TaxID=3420950 RepID=UPI003D14EB4F